MKVDKSVVKVRSAYAKINFGIFQAAHIAKLLTIFLYRGKIRPALAVIIVVKN